METASFFIYFWAGLLGFFTLREQFRINYLETFFVGGVTVLLVLSTWHFSNRYLEKHAQVITQEIAYHPLPFAGKKPGNKYKAHR
jgi:uncharacterized iron-regulated membrane protein